MSIQLKNERTVCIMELEQKQHKKNSFVEMLELFDENGDVDLDLVYSEIKANMPESGIKIEIPGVSIGVTLKNNDIDTLYKYMIE